MHADLNVHKRDYVMNIHYHLRRIHGRHVHTSLFTTIVPRKVYVLLYLTHMQGYSYCNYVYNITIVYA